MTDGRWLSGIALAISAMAGDPAMEAPRVITSPGVEYSDAYRRFQGIPGIAQARSGRLWAVWYSGDVREGPRNYVVLASSENSGQTWSGPRVVIDPDGFVRAFDACVWTDAQNRLWVFWSQAAGHWDGRAGVWTMMTTEPGAARPRWSAPRRIADGVMMNKPIVRAGGEWLLPVTLWPREANLPFINERDRLNLSPAAVGALVHDPPGQPGSHIVLSADQGQTFQRLPSAPFPPEDGPTENILVERMDRSLWMLARTRYGIGESVSPDGGRSWESTGPSGIAHPPTRFFVTRLRSGRLLMVKNAPPNGKDRSHLTAIVSSDEGGTWSGGLLLDDRINVSYPDGVEGDDGRIYVVYDRERFSEREILMAVFREDDVSAGKSISGDARLRVLVNRANAADVDPKRSPVEGKGWVSLINGRDTGRWRGRDDKPHRWHSAKDVYIKPQRTRDILVPVGGPGGPVLVNGLDGRTEDLVTADVFGDFELYLEFLVTAKSNSGIYLHGLYEIQILDNYGWLTTPGVHDNAAIYEQWIDNKGVGGSPPAKNVSLPPGEWQSFHVWFRAPRFDGSGKKIEDARILRLDHNGVTVQHNVPLPGPTRASLDIPEAARNPLMIQGDHGPIALRNIAIRMLKTPSLAGAVSGQIK